MPKRARAGSGQALMEIALLSPAIIAARTQAMMLGSTPPGRRDRKELARMMSEKPLAMAESMAGAQQAFMKQSFAFWSGAGNSSGLFWFDMAEDLLSASLAPISRRVRGNARRLKGR